MTKILDYTSEHEQDWRSYVDKSSSTTLCHQIEWREILRDSLGHRPHYLLAHNQGKVTGVLPLFLVTTWWRTKYLISIPWLDYGGVSADDAETEKRLLERAREIGRETGAEFVEMRTPEASEADTAQRTDKVTFLLDLTAGEEALWKGFKYKLRNHIRKADKSKLTSEWGRENLLDEFYTVFATNMRDLGTPVWGKDLFVRVLERFPEQADIVVVRKGDWAIGAGMILSFKDKLYIPSSSTYRSERKLCPNYALYWQAIKRGANKGFAYFDFGRSTIDGATYSFKKQWQPEHTQLTWQYLLLKANEVPAINPDNPKYDMFIKMWQRLPVGIANVLGPHVIKNFP